ncbi:MAG TPA: hypothetical protein VF883_03015 [Thermoanaerobaculia bacterium]
MNTKRKLRDAATDADKRRGHGWVDDRIPDVALIGHVRALVVNELQRFTQIHLPPVRERESHCDRKIE